MADPTRDPVLLSPDDLALARQAAPLFETGALPAAIAELLRAVIHSLAQGHAVTLLTDPPVLTPQRAADLLGVSRAFLVNLLEAGAIPQHRVNKQRRVLLRDVLDYIQQRDKERNAALDRMALHAFTAGLYDRNVVPPEDFPSWR